MKPLLLIILCCCTGLARAQHFSKKKVDPKTGDTTQMTREWIVTYPLLKNMAWGEKYNVYWGLKKLMAKGHREDTLLFCLDFTGQSLVPPKYHGRITLPLIPTPGNNDLQVNFINGDSLRLPLKSTWLSEYDSIISYVLSPEAIREMTTGQISAIKVSTTVGPVTYKLRSKRALNIKERMGLLVGSK